MEIFDVRTFERRATFTCSMAKAAMLFLAAAMPVSFATMALLSFAPVREWLTGHDSAREQERLVALAGRLSELRRRVAEQDSQIKSFQRLSGRQDWGDTLCETSERRTYDLAPNTTIVATTVVMPVQTPPRPGAAGLSSATASLAKPLRNASSQSDVPTFVERDASNGSDASRGNSVCVGPPTTNSVSELANNLSLVRPVEGVLVRGYENERPGVEVAAPEGAPVRAAADGEVVRVEYSDEYGHVVAIAHANNALTLYKHNKATARAVGSRVSAGELIAFVGDGDARGPRLLFELWLNGSPVNPTAYLNYPSAIANSDSLPAVVSAVFLDSTPNY
ncbi:MAG: M23 family metallopeptidase [Bacteroidia bacterium]|nr:M23 family metallopeptidase [Bacteroidia bacterium]MDW8333583.1 M23 family metallopeptidase [Bacteroidia bacterium]